MTIHPTAIVDPKAELDPSVSVGPYAVIGAGVSIGADSIVGSHAVFSGPTRIGRGNLFGPHTVIGAPPQDLKYSGEPTELIIGDHNRIREFVSIHRGTVTGLGQTTVGSGNLLMAYVHIAHDCVVGNQVVMANAATLAGHVTVENHAIIGGLTAVQQFLRIGTHAYIGGLSGVSKDVPPYLVLAGIRNQMRLSGINRIGLQRAGFSAETIKNLLQAYRILFRTPGLLLQDALARVMAEVPACPEVRHLVEFIQASKRGVVRTTSDGQ